MSYLNGLVDKMENNVIQEISHRDEMYQDNKEHYFHVGQSAIECIFLAIMASGKDIKSIKRILDLPCGYGRIMRMLKVAFPEAQLTASDLLHDGVDFCARVFNAIPLFSEKQIKMVVSKEKYDLVWCGSLLTHLDSYQWPNFINFFCDHLAPEGILVFTTHGRYVTELIKNDKCTYGIDDPAKLRQMVHDFDLNGFGYCNYMHSDDYGISLSKPSFVVKLLEQQDGLRILNYFEKGWDNHQDVVACINSKD